MLSGAVAKTFGWKQEGDTVSALIGSQFELMQVRNGASVISAFLSKVYGRTIMFNVVLEEKKVFVTEQNLPVEVQILRDTFKGTVID